VVKITNIRVMKEEEKKWFLSLPKEMKLTLLEDMMKEGETGMAFATMKILLDAPISEGGILTDDIKEVMDTGIANLKRK
tara:strand:- start:36 stop:272 length:237 start_codon:yes stop_codon:yes gene_type:complete